MLEQIEEGKKNISQTMSPQQLAAAEVKVAARLKNSKKQLGFAGGGQVRTIGQWKVRVGAR
jgi:hypothetical protein